MEKEAAQNSGSEQIPQAIHNSLSFSTAHFFYRLGNTLND